MTTLNRTWRRTAARKIARMSASQARDTLASIRAEGATIFHPAIRALTGGFNSQSINFHVIRLLGKRAGISN